MRLAAYNVENLFLRAKVFGFENPSDGQAIIKKVDQLNALISKAVYSEADKSQMLRLMEDVGLLKSDEAAYVRLRRNRGTFVVRPRKAPDPVRIEASGRGDWIGWFELEREPIREEAVQMTGRVIRDVDADLLVVVEAESRPALVRFSADILPLVDGRPYDQAMLIDGNDERGIDVGVYARAPFAIGKMKSNVDFKDNVGQVFSRDCPVYEISLPGNQTLFLLPNHFKSKSGDQAKANAKRRRQAVAVADIYRSLIATGASLVAVLGDLNDSPDSAPLEPLLQMTDLKDISSHPAFDDLTGGKYPGTFGGSTARNKIDYLLMSPKLFEKVQGGGLFRKGMWPGVKPKKWDVYDELESESLAASDHAAIFADIAL